MASQNPLSALVAEAVNEFRLAPNKLAWARATRRQFEELYPNPRTRRSVFARIRSAIKTAGAEKQHIDELVLSDSEYEQIDSAYRSKLRERNFDENLEPLDPADYFKAVTQLLASKPPAAQIALLMAITGRRQHEIVISGKITKAARPNWLVFSGQAKTKGREKATSYEIPTLHPKGSAATVRLWNRLRRSLQGKPGITTKAGANVVLHKTLARDLQNVVRISFGKDWNPHKLRSAYAFVTYRVVPHAKMDYLEWVAQVLGHLFIQNGTELDDPETSRSYVRFRMVDVATDLPAPTAVDGDVKPPTKPAKPGAKKSAKPPPQKPKGPPKPKKTKPSPPASSPAPAAAATSAAEEAVAGAIVPPVSGEPAGQSSEQPHQPSAEAAEVPDPAESPSVELPPPHDSMRIAVAAIDSEIAAINSRLTALRAQFLERIAADEIDLERLRQARERLIPVPSAEPAAVAVPSGSNSNNETLAEAPAPMSPTASSTQPSVAPASVPAPSVGLRRNNTAKILAHMATVGPQTCGALYESLKTVGLAPPSQNALSSVLRRLQANGAIESASDRERYNLWQVKALKAKKG